MKELQAGWYILLYHDISWEENCYIQYIGGTCSPDVFRQHVSALTLLGDLVSVTDGEKLLHENAIDSPIFSFWFDDGLAGVLEHAMPILDEFGVTGTISICSRFVCRSEFFWRFKLSYLKSINMMDFLRIRISRYGYTYGNSVKSFTLDNFSAELLEDINELFLRFTIPTQGEDAYRMFLDRAAIRLLYDHGWNIVNHSAGHYPISQEHCLSLLCSEFMECEAEIQEICQKPSRYWVLPFDRNTSRDVVRIADACRGDRYIVFMGNRRNISQACNPTRILFRLSAIGSSEGLIHRLRSS